MKRRKALVENLYKHSSLRVRSETDLTKIDREATFNCASLVERNELMERVVDAYHTTYSGTQSTNTTVSTDFDDGRSRARKVRSTSTYGYGFS